MSLPLRYLPYLLLLLVGLAVLYDGRVRLSRRRRASWAAALQGVTGAAMALLAVIAIVVAPDIGLIDEGSTPFISTERVASLYLVCTLICLPTLAIGLVWPARPHPRRGLTALALIADLLAAVSCGWLLTPTPLLL